MSAGDHPRGCGEKRRVLLAVGLAAGSSPRVRGEGVELDAGGGGGGIIPAGAGRR